MSRIVHSVVALAVVAGALLVNACDDGVPMRFAVTTPHDDYQARLRLAGLDATALGRDWIAAAQLALAAPAGVTLPHREARYLDPARAVVVAYRLKLERGQRLMARLELLDAERSDIDLFLDLFFVPDSVTSPRLVASADSSARVLEYVALRPGDYILRVQPELLRGGRVGVSVSGHASLGFPVAGRDVKAIRSRFGAPRDGGRRDHHGVDIFAPRGTPVVAAVAGQVSRVTTNRLGGKVIWLRESTHGRRLYYAHLDRQSVVEDQWVIPGDTLGFVGNTGNARRTPPHLHFGIYLRGEGPVDPFFHLYEPRDEPSLFAGDTGLVGRWARVTPIGARLYARPGVSGPVIAQLLAETPVEVMAGTGRWYLARLPDGQAGYLGVRDLSPLDSMHLAAVAAATVLRTVPTPGGAAMDSVAGGEVVPVLGRYGDYVMVRRPDGVTGWIGSGSLAASGEALIGTR